MPPPVENDVVENDVVDVDVVIAARNESASLGECLEAIAAQDYPRDRVRIIVCDDRSADGTAAIAARNGCTVVTAAAPGPAAARNAGIRAGRAPLVAFLDAHSVPAPNWLAALARVFDDPRVGGCQARLISRARHPRVDRFVRESATFSPAGVTEQTVAGVRTLYPWLLTGNSIYRRAALEDAGLFEEALIACEDVDLGWRVVLAGYLLLACDDTEVVHVEGRSWRRFVGKGWTYGRGAARVARAYAGHGAATAMSPALRSAAHVEETLSGVCYWGGHLYERAIGGRSAPALAPRPLPDVRRWRDPFAWTPSESLAISPGVLYWFNGGSSSIVVHVAARQRLVLDGAGDFIWRRLALGRSRRAIVDAMVETYGIAARTGECDADDFVDELASADVVIRRQTSLGP